MLQKTNKLRARVTAVVLAAGLTLLFSGTALWAQKAGTKKDQTASGNIYTEVDQMPEFDGDINNYLAQKLNYPETARKTGKEGRVGVRFVVDKTGKVRDVVVFKKSGTASLDEEALRVVRNMPDWKPGMNNGKPVNVYFTLPIAFKLG